jgi:hypothetical protein
MSNTPQTDKLHNARHETDPLSAYYLMRDLARQLEVEREDALNAWRMSSVCRRLAEERDLWKAEAERWREQAGENFQVTAWKQLIEQERNRMRGL